MKKLILISAALILYILPGFSQLLKPVKIDSLVTISLPPVYTKKDTLGQQIFSANSMLGYMVVIKAPNAKNNAPLKQEKDLNKVLKDYIQGIQSESGANAEAQNIRDTTIGTLKAKNFILQTQDDNGNVQFRNLTLIYTTEATYTFEYVYPEVRKDYIHDEFMAYIGSIKLSRDLQRNDQYLFKTSGFSPTLKIVAFSAGGVLLILLVLFLVKRKPALS
ncbi:MAG: hypothetical protein ACXVAY_08480 [Mucilaginibacter sp.]